jgi:hypothetical protein
MEAKKIVSTMDGPILYIWLSGVITIMLPSLISVYIPNTFSPFSIACKLQLLFRLPIAKRKHTLP